MSPSLCTRIGLAGAAAVVLALAGIAAAETLAKAKLAAASNLKLPDYLVPVTDPDTGATIVRVTTPGPLGAGLACRRAYCTHRYSSAQAWNANQTLLLIANGCNGLCFLDGRTYAPLFRRNAKTSANGTRATPSA